MIAFSATNQVVPLHCLNANERGTVRELDGDEHTVMRLQEMGIRPGTQLRMVKPGMPSLVCVDGKRFSIRCDGSIDILVELQAAI